MVREDRRKVVGTGQMRKRKARLQEQMLSIARITHAIAEATGQRANREKGDAACEHAHRVEIGVRAERPDPDQCEGERRDTDARKQAELKRHEQDRDDIQKLGRVRAITAGLAQREDASEQARGRCQHDHPPLGPMTHRKRGRRPRRPSRARIARLRASLTPQTQDVPEPPSRHGKPSPHKDIAAASLPGCIRPNHPADSVVHHSHRLAADFEDARHDRRAMPGGNELTGVGDALCHSHVRKPFPRISSS